MLSFENQTTTNTPNTTDPKITRVFTYGEKYCCDGPAI